MQPSLLSKHLACPSKTLFDFFSQQIGTTNSLQYRILNLFLFVFAVRVGQPCRVARRVMEKSPHSLLVGEGAEAFVQEQGFTIEPNDNMLSRHTLAAYQVFASSVCSSVGAFIRFWDPCLVLFRYSCYSSTCLNGKTYDVFVLCLIYS